MSKEKSKKLYMLENWAALNAGLVIVQEEECKQLLDHEKTTARRLQFMLRLYGRFNKLRTQRERREICQRAAT